MGVGTTLGFVLPRIFASNIKSDEKALYWILAASVYLLALACSCGYWILFKFIKDYLERKKYDKNILQMVTIILVSTMHVIMECSSCSGRYHYKKGKIQIERVEIWKI